MGGYLKSMAHFGSHAYKASQHGMAAGLSSRPYPRSLPAICSHVAAAVVIPPDAGLEPELLENLGVRGRSAREPGRDEWGGCTLSV